MVAMNQPFEITRHTPFEDLPEFLSVDELSVYLGISRGLCYDLLKRGELPSVRFGRLIRVPKKAFEPPKPKAPARAVSARAL
jgi:excisionase family DNA binding protein